MSSRIWCMAKAHKVTYLYLMNLLGIVAVCCLTYRGRAILQTAFSNAFSWMENFVFRFEFDSSLFPWAQLTVNQHWFRKWLGIEQARDIIWLGIGLVYWRIYAPPLFTGLGELNERDFLCVLHVLPCSFQGIYRLAGVKSKVESLHQQIKSKGRVDLGEHPPVDIAAVLKLHLRQVRLRW